MSAISNIFIKTFVKQFYIANTGFFFFGFFFFFGMVNGSQLISYHYSLMLSIISSPVFMFVVMLGWLAYTVKCCIFCGKIVANADNSFLHIIKGLSASHQWLLCLLIGILLYFPVLSYASVIIYIAIGKSSFVAANILGAFQLIMVLLCAATLRFTINDNSDSLLKNWLLKVAGFFQITARYPIFLLLHILHRRKLAFGTIKIFSLLLLSVSFIRNGDSFDKDFFGIFFQIILMAQAGLVFNCVDFMESLLQQNRNLPISWMKVAGMYTLTWCIIMLPEITFMIFNNHGNLSMQYLLQLSLIAIAMLLLYTSIVYACKLNRERYMTFIFIAFIMLFFLLKSGYNFLSLFSIIGIGLLIFKTHFYSFEREK